MIHGFAGSGASAPVFGRFHRSGLLSDDGVRKTIELAAEPSSGRQLRIQGSGSDWRVQVWDPSRTPGRTDRIRNTVEERNLAERLSETAGLGVVGVFHNPVEPPLLCGDEGVTCLERSV
ncbi:MAG: hypothetical protein AB7P76_00795 [Candidatus Melainabacteria bacterium]